MKSNEIMRFSKLAEFLKPGRTAAQIAAAYKLGGPVQAKRFVAAAMKAGVSIGIVKGSKPAGSVGRRPDVYFTAA